MVKKLQISLLVKEMLGKMGDLTPKRLYHKDSGVKKYLVGNIFHISPSNFRVIVAYLGLQFFGGGSTF